MSERIAGEKVVVTGGAGFIGSHLCAALLARGAAEVTVVDSLRYGDRANLAALPRLTLVKHCLGTDCADELARVLAGARYLFHLAAEKHNQSKDEPARVLAANVAGTATLLELAGKAGVRKVVFTSSLYAYGRVAGAPFDEAERPEPRTVYGISKLAGEHLTAWAAREHGFAYNVLRYLFVYGPKQFAGMGYKSVIVKSFERLLAGVGPVVYGDGEQRLDYVYVDDAVEATLAALERDVSGEVLNIGSGRATSVNELVDAIVRVSGKDLPPTHGPADWTAGSVRVANPDKTARVLGWRATTPLAEGLARTYAWVCGAR
ncbi:MAG: NAD-dependent epimerase/dehydratase family protein [Myxococcales bacterium]|nr:NAD-dependent epimerase/dehydratase family protein [Myxococcales bacterium]